MQCGNKKYDVKQLARPGRTSNLARNMGRGPLFQKEVKMDNTKQENETTGGNTLGSLKQAAITNVIRVLAEIVAQDMLAAANDESYDKGADE